MRRRCSSTATPIGPPSSCRSISTSWGGQIEATKRLAVGAYREDLAEVLADRDASRHARNGDAPDLDHAFEVDDAEIA